MPTHHGSEAWGGTGREVAGDTMNPQEVALEWIHAGNSNSPNTKGNEPSQHSSMPFSMPQERTAGLEVLLTVFLSLLSHCLK